MKFSIATALLVSFLGHQATFVVGSTAVGKAIYNKWHETELDRWLNDYNIPHASPADRADLEKAVKEHWNSKFVAPYEEWDAQRLNNFLSSRGEKAKIEGQKNKQALVNQIKQIWLSGAESATDTKEWIFDSWSDSQLRSFLVHYNVIKNPPTAREKLLQAAKDNYDGVAKKLGETTAYPGDWLYASWSDSDLRKWLQEHGVVTKDKTPREKLLSAVRSNWNAVRIQTANAATAGSESIKDATDKVTQKVTDTQQQLVDTWSEAKLRLWAKENKVSVPQGIRHEELVALVNRERKKVEKLAASKSSDFHAATTSAGNTFARATEDASLVVEETLNQLRDVFDWALVKLGWLSNEDYATEKGRREGRLEVKKEGSRLKSEL